MDKSFRMVVLDVQPECCTGGEEQLALLALLLVQAGGISIRMSSTALGSVY